MTFNKGGIHVLKRAIKAKEAVADIRSGMDDASLMEKYHLSAEGLQSLFDKLVTGGFIDLSDIARRLPGYLGVVAITECAPARRTGEAIASTPPLKTKSPPLINVQEAARDIRWGIEDPAIMEKYRLSPRELRGLLDKLLSAGLITQADLDRRHFLNDHTVDLREEMLSFTEALQELGLSNSGSSTSDGDGKPKLARPNHTAKERTKEEKGLSRIEGTKTPSKGKVYSDPDKMSWYDRPTAVVLLLIGLFPLGLYALYRNSTLSARIKSSLIAGWVLLVTIYLVLVFGNIVPEGLRSLLKV
jgi:hypothetical protein